ncbi:Ger(x)C family spore germination protein [Psychrobacillus soli]|uniref:Ger(X)C family spore germination protein n=1 Tax=Psychrobacillus soli TaxID=1543965 RepID=A0A544TM16_9BACI|nr:Ger(x)C family spore germination protein [Psychrobacillus soli]TQR18478.1 Ger(x)C family spore germination protein [Psychrobacillus soli]
MKIFKFYFILLFLPGILSGCVETNILDRVGLTTLVGYDAGTEEKIATTAVIREVNPEFQSNVEVVTTENETSKGNRMKANRKLSKKIMVGQMRVILFGEELAKDDLHFYIDTHLENASISNSLYLAVVEGETAPLLQYEYKNIDDIGQHIYRLIEQNVKQEHMISSSLHEIAHDFYMEGKDSAMPIIKREDDLIELTGIALFSGGKMVSTLPVEDSFYVKLVRDSFTSGIFETIIQKEDIPPNLMTGTASDMPVAFDAIRSKRVLKLVDPTTPEFDLQLKLKARLLEVYPDVNLGDPKVVEGIENAVSKNLSREISRVIAHSQNVQSDIFGFGEKYRSSVRNSNLTKEKWHEMYKNMKVNIKVEFDILRDGVFE